MNDPLNITNTKICNSKFTFGKYWTRGVEGIIYHVKEPFYNKKCIAKIISIKTPHGRSIKQNIKKEIMLMTKSSSAGISPKIYRVFFCNINNQEHAVILMEKYGDGTFSELLNIVKQKCIYNQNTEDLLEDIKLKVNKLVLNLSKLKINHQDLHASNILYKFTSRTTVELKVIDFGIANLNNKFGIISKNNSPQTPTTIISTLSNKTTFRTNMNSLNQYITTMR